jgi:arginyl-tRNA synthetase
LPAEAIRRLADELAGLVGTEVELERPSDPAHGDYATNVALRTAPARKRPPRELAQELAGTAARLEAVERAEVAGPGFLNLWLTSGWYEQALGEILDRGDRYGAGEQETRQRILVELVSPNPTGPLVVGSARNGAYGDSIARLLEFAGVAVVRECYFNDVGRQVDLFRESVEARRRGEEPPEGGYVGEYVARIAELPGDPVEEMIALIERELEEFRISIDVWVHQSALEAEIADALEALPTFEQEGARWVRTTGHGDDKDRVVVRSDGSFTYFASDAAYMRNKFERGFDRVIYVLAADHHGYVPRLRALADAFGYGADRVEVPIYQLVNIVEGGEAKRGSKRRGDVVFLRELIDAIGVDAARWYLVSRGHDQTIEIDVDLAAERSQKNPVYYVQYAHARIAGILRNAGDAAIASAAAGQLAVEERDLIKRLAEFPAVAAEATERRAPHAIPLYAIRVADDFHRFYHEHRVVGSDAEAFRLGLCRATQTVIARCLDLIGVEAPERM